MGCGVKVNPRTYRVPNGIGDTYKLDYNFYMRCHKILSRNGKDKLVRRMLRLSKTVVKLYKESKSDIWMGL